MAWKLAQSSLLDELYVAPGNPGTVRHGRNVDLDLKDQKTLRAFLLEKNIRIVVVGPEGPLVDGLHDRIAADPQLQGQGHRDRPAQGRVHSWRAARTSPRSSCSATTSPRPRTAASVKGQLNEALDHLERMPRTVRDQGRWPGRRQGRGDLQRPQGGRRRVIKGMLDGGSFGAAGERVVIEQFLNGVELSAPSSSPTASAFKMLPAAKDYKRIGDGDTGPNTGGMGAVSARCPSRTRTSCRRCTTASRRPPSAACARMASRTAASSSWA